MNVTFQIPPFFQEIVPGLDPDQARAQAAARVGHRATPLSEEDLDALGVEYARASASLAAANVFYAATCLGTIDGDLSSGTLLIARQPLSYRDPRTAVTGIGEVMERRHGPDAAVRIWDLPCGEAVLVFEQNASLRIPAEMTASGEDFPVEVAQVQAFIPVPYEAVPGAQDMIVITFSTPSTDHWEDYSEVLAAFLRSLTFTPDEAAAPVDVLAN
ncbi:hypothetical protein ACFV9W_31865 [Streptomyces sp. NPDC059897]|uniref:hypothetical protein n=1 Tax=Streptomyces sp. NPDC059897 TaxID=3346994 RepID=UPI0036590D3E